jgi:uncharacterized protein YbaP (TraB family)
VKTASRAFRRFEAALCLSVLCCLASAALSSPCLAQEPGVFLWKVQGEAGALYLLGSIHLAREDASPLDGRIEQAYRESSRVVFEADLKEAAGAAIQKAIVEEGMCAKGATIHDHVSGDTFRLLKKKARAAGIPVSQFEGMKPWLCAITLSLVELDRLGFRPDLGLDAYLTQRAASDGKEMLFLETARFQIELLSGLPGDLQEELLRQALRELEVIGSQADAMASAWKRGDAGALEAILGVSLSEYPRIRQRLFIDRNEQWMPRLEALLAKEGDVLVVVGAGHLVGEGGLLELLSARGLSVVQQ